jgi:hypothetical protein
MKEVSRRGATPARLGERGTRMNTRQTGHAQERPAAVRVSDFDRRMMHAIERFIVGYAGDDLLHDIELTFPTAFFLAYCRARDPLRWIGAEGNHEI